MKREVMFCIFIIFMLVYIHSCSAANSSKTDDISMKLGWDASQIVNGNEFKIKVDISNLNSEEYDMKVFIYDADKNKPISQIQNAEGKWISSTNYLKGLMKGPGEQSREVNLRIKTDFVDFSGNAKIGVRIRVSGSSKYVESEDDIDILKGSKNQDTNAETDSKTTTKNTKTDIAQNNNNVDNKNEIKQNTYVASNNSKASKYSTTGEVIRLENKKSASEDIKSQENIVYESKNESIKKYAIYGFALLCVVLIVLLIWRK